MVNCRRQWCIHGCGLRVICVKKPQIHYKCVICNVEYISIGNATRLRKHLLEVYDGVQSESFGVCERLQEEKFVPLLQIQS